MFARTFAPSFDAAGRDPRIGEVAAHGLPGAVFAAVAWCSPTRSTPGKTLVNHVTSLVADAFEVSVVTRPAPSNG